MEQSLVKHLALLNPSGRLSCASYWLWSIPVMLFLATVPPSLSAIGIRPLALLLYMLGYWALICLMAKRCHDIGRSAWWVLLLLIPILGIIWAVAILGFRRGERGDNQYGPDSRRAVPDYLSVRSVI